MMIPPRPVQQRAFMAAGSAGEHKSAQWSQLNSASIRCTKMHQHSLKIWLHQNSQNSGECWENTNLKTAKAMV